MPPGSAQLPAGAPLSPLARAAQLSTRLSAGVWSVMVHRSGASGSCSRPHAPSARLRTASSRTERRSRCREEKVMRRTDAFGTQAASSAHAPGGVGRVRDKQLADLARQQAREGLSQPSSPGCLQPGVQSIAGAWRAVEPVAHRLRRGSGRPGVGRRRGAPGRQAARARARRPRRCRHGICDGGTPRKRVAVRRSSAEARGQAVRLCASKEVIRQLPEHGAGHDGQQRSPLAPHREAGADL
jgi:hypothetical protein